MKNGIKKKNLVNITYEYTPILVSRMVETAEEVSIIIIIIY